MVVCGINGDEYRMATMSDVELTLWVSKPLASWLSSQASRNGMLRHRYAEKTLEEAMETTKKSMPEPKSRHALLEDYANCQHSEDELDSDTSCSQVQNPSGQQALPD